MISNQKNFWWLSLFVLCAVLGALIGLSFKTQNNIRRQKLPSSDYGGLAQEYLYVKQNNGNLQATVSTLQQRINQLENSASSNTKQSQVLVEDIHDAKFMAGLTEVTGPGLVLTLKDSKIPLPVGMPTGIAPPNIIHDTDINPVINELKAAGAEAVSINGQRLVATSWVRCAGPTVYVSDTPQTPPYIIKAIGNPKDLETAVNLPGGIADQLRQYDAAMISMKQEKNIVVPAYTGPIAPKYAKSVETKTSDARQGE